jgi:hypothetical protein
MPILSPISFASKPLGILILSDYISKRLKNIGNVRHFTIHSLPYLIKKLKKDAFLRHFSLI